MGSPSRAGKIVFEFLTNTKIRVAAKKSSLVKNLKVSVARIVMYRSFSMKTKNASEQIDAFFPLI